MSQTLENPFAVKQRRGPSRLLSGAKGLAMVAGLFAALVVAQAQSRRWLLNRWVSGFAELPVAEQVERLLQIDALGDIAIETVARRLAATEESVAATAYELLREHLNGWSTRDSEDLGRAHKNMIAGLEEIAAELSGQRARWAKELLNQSVVECVDRNSVPMDQAYQAAIRVLAILTPTSPLETASNQIVATDSEANNLDAELQYQHPRLVPLPVRMQNVEAPASAGRLRTTLVLPASTSTVSTAQREPEDANIAVPVAMRETTASDVRQAIIQPVRHLTNSSLETFDTKSVIMLLGNSSAAIRDQAAVELVRRNLSNEEIRVANQLASPIVDVRLGLLESIANRTDIDPRPWLLWLAEDTNREVRMRAISSLATMNDGAVKQSLRQRLTSEHDPTVIAHIRRIVGQR